MSLAVQHASIAAWSDEAHVRDNRARYREKFDGRGADARAGADVRRPTPASICGRGVPGGDDEAFARELFAATHVTVLPGRYLGPRRARREPGRGLRAHRARAGNRRLRRGRAAHRRVLPLMLDQTVHSAHSLESLIDAAFERRAEIIAGHRRAGAARTRSIRSSPS